MKNYILIILISMIPLSGYSQESTTKSFDLNSLIELFDMTKENTHAWLIEDDFFTFITHKEKYDGHVYGLNYNSDLKTAPVWLHKYYKLGEMYVIGGKDDLKIILEQLTPHNVESNVINDDKSIFSYTFMEKDFIVQIETNKPVSIKMIKTPTNQSDEMKIKRHKNMTKQN